MPPRFVAETEIYASHTQFYVVDPAAGARTDLVWDGGGLQRHLGAAEGIVAVGTIGYCDVPVRIELWESEPPEDLDEWDHVGEASLDLGSGRVGLEGVGGPGDLQPLEVEPGTYRTRSSAAGLAGADEMDGGDRYRIQLWPSPPAEPEVLRWWPTWDPRAVSPSPTTTGDGRMLLGAEAHDARVRMRWLKSRGSPNSSRTTRVSSGSTPTSRTRAAPRSSRSSAGKRPSIGTADVVNGVRRRSSAPRLEAWRRTCGRPGGTPAAGDRRILRRRSVSRSARDRRTARQQPGRAASPRADPWRRAERPPR